MAPCLGLGMREISGGQESPLFEAARTATLDRVTVVVQQLPAVHEAFQPFLPTQPSAYWSKLDDLFGKYTESSSYFYKMLQSWCQALRRVKAQ